MRTPTPRFVLATEIPTPDPRSLDDSARPFAEALSDRYAIKKLIGTGGMGMVYLARDRRLDRLVAIKTLPPHLAKDPEVRERFLRETRTAGAMAHANIVPIFGADEVNGHVFFVMAYVEGESLAARVRALGRLDADVVTRYLRDVAAALAHAHSRNIIHRDIKAENILVERASDRALVTDFGIARLAEASPLTVTGQVLGTVHYVSPEQVSGEVVDARSDIYSLGVVGYLALTGRFPFEGDVASAVLVQHVTRPAAPLSSLRRDVPSALASIVDRCLSKSPAHRFADAGELHAALEAALGDPSALSAGSAAPVARIAESEAKEIWKRAAELQAATGVQPRPTIVPRPRDAQRDAVRGAGLDIAEVRQAAEEAGIGIPYVEHALGEHGLIPGLQAPVPAPKSVERVERAELTSQVAERPSWWSGVPRHVVHEVVVPDELPARDVERLVNVLRDSTGTLGHTLAHTRELAWETGRLGMRLQVSVVPEESRTTIRVLRDSRRSNLLRALGTFVVVAFAATPLMIGFMIEVLQLPEEVALLVGFPAGLYGLWRAGRALIARGHRKIAERTQQLAERLAAKVRASIPAKKN